MKSPKPLTQKPHQHTHYKTYEPWLKAQLYKRGHTEMQGALSREETLQPTEVESVQEQSDVTALSNPLRLSAC